MIEILVTILILAIILGLVWWAISYLPIPSPFVNVIRVVIILIFIIYLLYLLVGRGTVHLNL